MTRRLAGHIDVLGVMVAVIETDRKKELDTEALGLVSGVYDPEQRLILVDSRLCPDAKNGVLGHEIGHALCERIGLTERLESLLPEKTASDVEEFLVDKFLPAYVQLWAAAEHLKFHPKRR